LVNATYILKLWIRVAGELKLLLVLLELEGLLPDLGSGEERRGGPSTWSIAFSSRSRVCFISS
jgi:hypothetical protein